MYLEYLASSVWFHATYNYRDHSGDCSSYQKKILKAKWEQSVLLHLPEGTLRRKVCRSILLAILHHFAGAERFSDVPSSSM